MNIIEWVKGVFRKMLSPQSIETALHIQPAISTKMRDAIVLWENMYKDESPWLEEDPEVKMTSLGIASMIASEKAQTATIEMQFKLTGESERGKYIKEQFEGVMSTIRTKLEYGIALGGLVIKPYVIKGPDGKLKINVTYITAPNFYPLAFSCDGTMTEVAFIDRIIKKEKVYSKLEHHKLEGTTLTITNLAFVSNMSSNNMNLVPANGELGNQISLDSVPDWAELPQSVTINNVDELLFAYFKMPQANTVDLNSPLGVSGFSRAVQLIRNADEQYSALLWEFEGGQLAVDVDRTALNPLLTESGQPSKILPKLQRRLFRHDLDLGVDEAYNVFSPALRDSSYINGLNTILMKIEDTCALARGTLSYTAYAEARTATELRILKQRSFSANEDIQKELERALKHVIRIMDKYCDLYSIVGRGDYEVSFAWDDSILVDKDTERQVDLMDVNNNLLSRVEYRMKWMGETEEQAIESLKKLDDAEFERQEKQQQFMLKYSETQNSGEAQTEQNKRQKASESGKVVKQN